MAPLTSAQQEIEALFHHLRGAVAHERLQEIAARASQISEIIRAIKKRANETSDSKLALLTLGLQSAATQAQLEARMWLNLRIGDPHGAWHDHVDAERWEALAQRCISDEPLGQATRGRASLREPILFPRVTYLSAGYNYTSASCSICARNISECDHLTGILYCGQVCAPVRHVGFVAHHVAIVEVPADKHCIVSRYRNEAGQWRDPLAGLDLATGEFELTDLYDDKFLVESIVLSVSPPPGAFL